MNKSHSIPIALTMTGMALFYYAAMTLTIVFIFLPAVIISYAVYLKTAYRKTPKPDRILPLYLLALGIQFLHFTEEYLTNFISVVPALFGQGPYPLDFWLTFNMSAYFVFILGGIVLFWEMKEYMILPIFFILVGVVFNSIAHIILAIYTGGYFSGLYTAIIYAVIGPVLLKRFLEETSVIKN